MSVNWTSYTGFSVAATCLPCCPEPVPTECSCALLIPPFASPYADYATAETELAVAFAVADCIGYCDAGSMPDLSGFSASVTATSIAMSSTFSAPVGGFGCWVCVSAGVGETLTITPSGGATDVNGTIYDCEGSTIEDFSVIGGAFTSATLPAGGIYYVYFNASVQPPSTTTGTTATITSSGTLAPNPVIALWDDGGTTRQLEACPKMLLPPLTESTGTWYADCATAAGVITDQVSNCAGYCELPFSTFTATDGGTSLTLAVSTGAADPQVEPFGSVNVVGGETITVTFTATASAGTVSNEVNIYDQDGTLVDAMTGSSPLTSSAVPYTGRYLVEIRSSSDDAGASMSTSYVITSSGTMSVNEIQALYDVGLTCPARLNCGDAC